MKTISKKLSLSLIGLMIFSGCNGTSPTDTGSSVIKGATKTFMDAELSTWAKVDANKKVTELGFTVPLKAIENAPTNEGAEISSARLDFPKEVQDSTFVNFVSFDYNPQGHEPPNIYDLPHFDLHFYTNSQSEVEKIDCSSKVMPTEDMYPKNFMLLPPDNPQCVPQMGFHASDVTSPELQQENPQKFTKTMILGYYDGKMNFIEPMITKEYLMGKNDFTLKWETAAKNSKSTLMPTTFKGTFNSEKNQYEFVLTDLVEIK